MQKTILSPDLRIERVFDHHWTYEQELINLVDLIVFIRVSDHNDYSLPYQDFIEYCEFLTEELKNDIHKIGESADCYRLMTVAAKNHLYRNEITSAV